MSCSWASLLRIRWEGIAVDFEVSVCPEMNLEWPSLFLPKPFLSTSCSCDLIRERENLLFQRSDCHVETRQWSSRWRAKDRAPFFLKQDVHGGIWLVLRDDRALGDPRKSRTQNPDRCGMTQTRPVSFPPQRAAAPSREGRRKSCRPWMRLFHLDAIHC